MDTTESKTNGLWHLTCKVIFTCFKESGRKRKPCGKKQEGLGSASGSVNPPRHLLGVPQRPSDNHECDSSDPPYGPQVSPHTSGVFLCGPANDNYSALAHNQYVA